MHKYEIYFKSSAEKELQKLDPRLIKLIIRKIEVLSINPRIAGAIKLKGNTAYRYRVGEYRIIYEVDDLKRIVSIFRIRHRRSVYKDI